MGDLPVGGVAAEVKPVSSHSTSFAEPNRLEIGAENWAAADRAAAEIIRKVQPTHVSEERRKEVVDYIQRLIRDCLGAEVFPYGSVPLKTYLPDGDIDLTAFGGANAEDTLADRMISILEEEERNTGAEFIVKDVQLIRAEVKLVKCIVQDIVVDVSFNQIGGLCTLCFLEQVDRLIGRDHLFKRSIILIKAWCYYESRILGAHHGLISTYALETLVLYIFHLYHSVLDGPLAVLYKFLDHFSKFDWDTYFVSLNGQVRLSSLPAFVAEIPEDSGKDLLLTNDFLHGCLSMFSVPCDKNSRGFITKHLNILDPLKEDNNLGRSVSQGNFYRIRSAFSFGARTLGEILRRPQDSIAYELRKFFGNAMARHGGGQRPDVQDFDKLLISNRPVSPVPFSDSGFGRTDNFYQSVDEYEASSGKLSKYLPQGIERTLDTEKRDSVEGKHDYSSRDGSDDSDKLDNYEMYASLSDLDIDKLNLNHADADGGRVSRNEFAESLIPMDLTGDYDCYVQHLRFGRWCHEYVLSMHSMPLSPLPSGAPYPWEGLRPLLHYKPNGFSHHHNGFHPSPPIYGMPPVILPPVPFSWDDVPKHRGTGTYLPNTNMPLHGNRPSTAKGRNQAPSRSTRYNGRNTTFQDPNLLDRSSHELLQTVERTADAASATPTESHLVFPPHQNGISAANVPTIQKVGIEVESVLETSRAQRTVCSSPRTPSGVSKQQTALSREQDRVSLRSSYRLKDEDDFPPLST